MWLQIWTFLHNSNRFEEMHLNLLKQWRWRDWITVKFANAAESESKSSSNKSKTLEYYLPFLNFCYYLQTFKLKAQKSWLISDILNYDF